MNKFYPADIEPLMEAIRATLADLDFAHERELAKIENGSGDESLKARLRAKLDARHRERREPYFQQLNELQKRIQAREAA